VILAERSVEAGLTQEEAFPMMKTPYQNHLGDMEKNLNPFSPYLGASVVN
jgi:hypothetical protein